MKEISIRGIGFLTSLGKSPQEVWESLTTHSSPLLSQKLPFTSLLPPPKKRRTDRFSDMVVFAGGNALRDAEEEADEKLGTVFTTGYGPLTGNVAFARKVALGDPDICSPTAFSGTVSNACVGHLCMFLGCKGPSTMLTGSDAVGSAQMLLSSDKTDRILCGAVEEYEEALYTRLQEVRPLPCGYSEAAVSLLLSSEKGGRYGKIVSFAEGYLGGYPLFGDVDEETALKQMTAVLTSDPDFSDVDLVLSNSDGTFFDKTETKALSVLGDIPAADVKQYFGETLGCAFTLSVAVGALLLSHGVLPAALGKEKKLSRILVTGYDVSGNYTVMLLEK